MVQFPFFCGCRATPGTTRRDHTAPREAGCQVGGHRSSLDVHSLEPEEETWADDLAELPDHLDEQCFLSSLRDAKDRVDEIVAEWDPTLTLDTVEVDHSASPLAMSIAVSGPQSQSDPNALAALLSEQEGEEVAVSVRYTALLASDDTNS